jgi:hypothetical protein
MKIIIVDAKRQTIDEAVIGDGPGDLHAILDRNIGNELSFHTFGGLSDADRGVQFVCDDWALKREAQRFFRIRGYPHPLGGTVVFFGFKRFSGESMDVPPMLLKVLRENVTWCPPTMRLVRFDETTDKVMLPGGLPATRTTITPVFEGEHPNPPSHAMH